MPATARSSQFSKDVIVGGRARLLLKSPLFPVRIEPISQEVQTIDSFGDQGTWAWQVRADKPGGHELSLVLSIFGPNGEEVEIENPRAELVLNAQGSLPYYGGLVWRGIIDFMNSLTTMIIAGAAAVAAIAAGIRYWVRKRSAKNLPEAQSAQGGLDS